MEHVCKVCGKAFKKGTQLGGHIVTHNEDWTKRVSEGQLARRIEVKKNCPQCNTEFTVIRIQGKKPPKKERAFCSRRCSNIRKHTDETKQKIADKLRKSVVKPKAKKVYSYNRSIANWLAGLNNGTYNGGHTAKWVKRWVIEQRGNKCEICGWAEINQTTGVVPINLDHIDGDSQNNHPNNLRLLCPNHHSLTPTYGSLNKGKGRDYRRRWRKKLKSL